MMTKIKATVANAAHTAFMKDIFEAIDNNKQSITPSEAIAILGRIAGILIYFQAKTKEDKDEMKTIVVMNVDYSSEEGLGGSAPQGGNIQ